MKRQDIIVGDAYELPGGEVIRVASIEHSNRIYTVRCYSGRTAMTKSFAKWIPANIDISLTTVSERTCGDLWTDGTNYYRMYGIQPIEDLPHHVIATVSVDATGERFQKIIFTEDLVFVHHIHHWRDKPFTMLTELQQSMYWDEYELAEMEMVIE